jgi:glycosyltransferase involved in cell wall biosynthesis
VKISIVGTRGIPAKYGGFETAAEEIGARLAAAGHKITVYGRERGPREYRGMRSVYLPTIRTKYTETLAHSALSIGHVVGARPDVALVFNAANAPLATLLRLVRIPFAVHVDGLEWKRDKWSGIAQSYYRAAERVAVNSANALIADSQGIVDYYRQRYGANPFFAAYGAPERLPGAWAERRLADLSLRADAFHLVVARFEPENHVREILQGFTRSRARLPLIVVGTAPYSAQYRSEIEAIAEADSRILLLGPIWNDEVLDALYVGAASYIHGHSVGGTNPSLLRAAGAGACCIVYDVPFNREVMGDDGVYFTAPSDLADRINAMEDAPGKYREMGTRGRAHVTAVYDWDDVAARYIRLCACLTRQKLET